MLDDFWIVGPTLCKMFVLVCVCVCHQDQVVQLNSVTLGVQHWQGFIQKLKEQDWWNIDLSVFNSQLPTLPIANSENHPCHYENSPQMKAADQVPKFRK